jgi:SnoaL-like domain
MKNAMRAMSFIALGIFSMAVLLANVSKEQISTLIEKAADHPSKDIIQPTVMTRYELHSEDHTADVVAIESLWSNYAFYNDSHNGPGMESLFTDDAVVHIVWNNHGKLVPTFGIHPYQTPDGVNGGGCVLATRKDIGQYFGFNRTAKLGPENHNGLAISGSSHHEVTNKMVKVNDDGKTAMLTATWFSLGADSKGATHASDGGSYRVFFRKMPNGWDIADMFIIKDSPKATDECDMNGSLPRPPQGSSD